MTPKPKFYKNQPVKVVGVRGTWLSKHLEYIVEQETYPFRTTDGLSYKECKPDYDAVSLPNWIEHDGSALVRTMKQNEIGLFFDKHNYLLKATVGNLGKEYELIVYNVAKYVILTFPEYIE